MELIQGFIQPPKVQSAEDTIPTLCDRVENATLISDRRSAVLGLKAFAREYRESVVASGLKPLINTLKRDYVDESSVKSILETLLILFIRGDGDADLTRNWISQQSRLQNGKYPSPLVMKQEKQQADHFSLWIADAITQSDELVHLLIELLDTGNFHIRLYTIQLLEALVAARPIRSRNAIISLPTGVSTLVTLLGDIHEPIRDEAVLLIMAVVNESTHVQVLVAFENIFEKLFNIIEEEGGLRGSIVVNDCLLLIHNILRYNTSNQTLFLETGNLPKLAQILNEPLLGEEFFWTEQRVVNINTALDIISLTVDPASSTTPRNQTILLESNVLMIVLRLAFHHNIPKDVRPMALLSASDMIKGSELAQREFAKIDVPYFDPSLPHSKSQGQLVSIVALLFNWTFYTNSVHLFSLRVAAVELLKSYLYKSKEIQLEFLQSQIEEYNSKEASILRSNLFEVILDYDLELKLNPYKLFFAIDFLMYLFESDDEDSNELREMTRKVTTGNGFDEEERLDSIQTLSELTITSLTSEDIRIPISYITFLIFWLYGDQNAVNDFLTNRGTIQSLLSFSYQVEGDDITVKCLVTMLLGVSYEFSSKNSPFPRKDYFEYVTKTLGKDNYSSRISQFKSDSIFSGAPKEITLTPDFDETGLPQVYFSPYFVTFFNENYYRIKTALLHSCHEEPYAKISYETFEELQGQCHALKEEMKKLESENSVSLVDLERKLASLNEEYEKLNKEHGGLRENYSKTNGRLLEIEQELKELKETLKLVTNERDKLSAENSEIRKSLEHSNRSNATNTESMKTLENKLKNVTADKCKAEEGINKMTRELMSLTRNKGELESQTKNLEKRIDKLTNEFKKKEKSLENTIEKRDKKLGSLQTEIEQAEENIASLKSEKNSLIKDSGEWKSKFQNHDGVLLKMTDKLKSLSEKYKVLQTEQDTLVRCSHDAETESSKELASLRNELKALSAEKLELGSQKEELVGQISSLKGSYDSLCKKHEEETATLNNEIEELKKDLKRMSVLMEDLKASRDETVENFNGLQKRCETFKEEIKTRDNSKKEADKRFSALKQNFEVSTKDLEKLAKEKQGLNRVKESNEKELSRLLEEVGSKEKEICLLSKNAEELKKSLDQQKALNSNCERELRANLEKLEVAKNEALYKNKELEDKMDFLDRDRKSSEEQNLKTTGNLKERILEVERELAEEQSNIKQLESRLQNSEKSLESKDGEITQLETKIMNISSESSELSRKSESDMETCREAIQRLEKEKETNTAQIVELQKNLKTAAEEKDEKVRDLEKLERQTATKLSKLQKNSQNAEEEVMRVKKDMENKVQAFEKERELLNEGSDTVTKQYSEKITVLEDKLHQMDIEIEKRKKESEDAKSAADDFVEQLKSQLEEKVSEISNLRFTINEGENTRDVLESRLQDSVNSSKMTINNLEEELQSLKRYSSDKESQIKTNEEDLHRNVKEREKLESDIAILKRELNDSSKAFSELEVKADHLKESQESISAKLEAVESEKISAKKSLEKGIMEKNEEFRKREAEKNITVQKLTSLLEEKEEKVGKLEAEISRVLRLNEDLETQYKECSTKLNASIANESNTRKLESGAACLEKSSKALGENLEKMRHSVSKQGETIDSNTEERNFLKDQLKQAQESLLSLNSSVEERQRNLDAKEKNLEGEIEHLKSELHKVRLEVSRPEKENGKGTDTVNGASSEIDDLMLLVTDLDEKNTRYKTKLQELGIDLDSDEEEEEEEEE